MEGECGCPEAKEHLEAYIDGELGETEIATISAHLADCYPCGDRAEFERHLRVVIRENAAEVAPAGLVERVRERCREVSEHRAEDAVDGGPRG